MTDAVFKILQKLHLQVSIADIQNRSRVISLWANGFRLENGRLPTDAECDKEIEKLEKELGALQ